MPIRSIIFTSHVFVRVAHPWDVWLPGCVSGLAFLTAEKGSVFQVSLSWIVRFEDLKSIWFVVRCSKSCWKLNPFSAPVFLWKEINCKMEAFSVFVFPMDFSSFPPSSAARQHAMCFGHRWSRGHLVQLVRYILSCGKIVRGAVVEVYYNGNGKLSNSSTFAIFGWCIWRFSHAERVGPSENDWNPSSTHM